MMDVGQALLHMAELWDSPKIDEYGRCRKCYVLNYMYGLCNTIRELNRRGLISEEVADDILTMIGEVQSCRFKWPLTLEGAKARAEWCRAQVKRLAGGENDR
jgi:hypothetical protein